MDLFSKIYNGPSGSLDLIIIHGLFGMSDNWNSLGKQFSTKYSVHLIDLRNHGRSPHSEVFDYNVMCQDVFNYLDHNNIKKAVFLGHSLGGKVAMNFAFKYSERVEKLIVVDIAPKKYSVDFHKNLLAILNALDLDSFNKREEINRALSSSIHDISIRLFLMKNIYRNSSKDFAWKFNINGLINSIDNISDVGLLQGTCAIPACFIKGGDSDYITDRDVNLISSYFTNSTVITIPNTGHWIHAESPASFYDTVDNFLNK